MKSPESLERLINMLAKLPAIGRRSAERMALKLVTRSKDSLLSPLIVALQDVEKNLVLCGGCGGITTVAENPCCLCTSPDRDNKLLCVVEDSADVFLLERTNSFSGRYHVLQGKLSPQRGTGPAELRLQALLRRVQAGGVEEVILALNADVESDATAAFLTDWLKQAGVARVSHLAWGIPAGSGIAYSDPFSALVVGVDEPWEVCLLKLMVDVIQHSLPHNATQLSRDPQGIHHEVEKSFQAARQDRALISVLCEKLHKYNVFKEYEDRFFSLVRQKR